MMDIAEPGGAPFLSVHQLTLAAGTRVLFRDLDLVVEPGQLWAVLGKNGCGKTTLLRTLAGLHPLSRDERGSISFGHRPLRDWPLDALARERAWLPQKIADAFSATVRETVATGRFPHRTRFSSPFRTSSRGRIPRRDGDDAAIVDATLAALGIEDLAERDVLSLSGGERQRVAIATLLAQTPRMALLDEPTAHLDLDMQHRCMRLIADRVAARASPEAAIVTLHDINLAARYATHVLLFVDADQVDVGPKASVLDPERLSRAYGHRLRIVDDDGAHWFLAA